MLTLTF